MRCSTVAPLLASLYMTMSIHQMHSGCRYCRTTIAFYKMPHSSICGVMVLSFLNKRLKNWTDGKFWGSWKSRFIWFLRFSALSKCRVFSASACFFPRLLAAWILHLLQVSFFNVLHFRLNLELINFSHIRRKRTSALHHTFVCSLRKWHRLTAKAGVRQFKCNWAHVGRHIISSINIYFYFKVNVI